MSARQNKKQRKGRNNPNNRERTVTTLTEDPNSSYLIPLSSEDPPGALMSSPFSIASSAGNGPSSSAYQPPSSYEAYGYTDFSSQAQVFPQQAQQQPQQQQMPPAPSVPGKNDLERLENLKNIIKANQHASYRPIAQPAALAALYLGPIPTPKAQSEQGTNVDTSNLQGGAKINSAGPPSAGPKSTDVLMSDTQCDGPGPSPRFESGGARPIPGNTDPTRMPDGSWSLRNGPPPPDDRRRDLDRPPPSPRSALNGSNGGSDTRPNSNDRPLISRDPLTREDKFYDRDRERGSERYERDRRDWDRDRRSYERFRPPPDVIRRPPPEQRHYEPDYSDRGPRRGDPRAPPVDVTRPPHADSRAPISSQRAPSPDNRPVRGASLDDRHVKAAAVSEERRGAPAPPDVRAPPSSVRPADLPVASRPADVRERERDVPLTAVDSSRPPISLEERISRPSLQERISNAQPEHLSQPPLPPARDRSTYPAPVRDDPHSVNKGLPSPRSGARDYRPPPRPISRERSATSYRSDDRNYITDDRRTDAMDVDTPSRYNDSRPIPYNRPFSPPSAADLARDRARAAQYPPSPSRLPPPHDTHSYDDDRRYPPSRDWAPPYQSSYSDRRREWSAADEEYYKSRQWDRNAPPPPVASASDRDRYEREPPPPVTRNNGWETRDERERRDYPPPRAPSPSRPYDGPARSLGSRLTDAYNSPAPGGTSGDRPYASRDAVPPFSRVRQRSLSPVRRPGGPVIDDNRPPVKRSREDGYAAGEYYPPSTAPSARDPGAPLRRQDNYPLLTRAASPPAPSGGGSAYFDNRVPPLPSSVVREAEVTAKGCCVFQRRVCS
ncbi:hypothetical protein J132_09207 [Termitomyces sp. J132]|nr:hypothetical protein J132_09207 [Termitomyces sp. J132]